MPKLSLLRIGTMTLLWDPLKISAITVMWLRWQGLASWLRSLWPSVLVRFHQHEPCPYIVLNVSPAPKSQHPRKLKELVLQLSLPELPELMRRFLYNQLLPDADVSGSHVDLDECPEIRGRVYIYHSACATFYAPSDQSGIGGMCRERIRATPSWHGGASRNDCVFVTKDSEIDGMRGLHVARVQFFFSFSHNRVVYPCAFVEWFVPIGDAPCEDTGYWMVEPDIDEDGQPVRDVIHVDCIVRGALLIPIYGDRHLPPHIIFSNSLGAFRAYYVNKYSDYHAHATAF